jgi:hypothetical protein
MTNGIDKRALLEALTQDAAKAGISVQELIKRITSGAHQVIGMAPVRGAEMHDPPTYLSTGEGNMPQIEDRHHGGENGGDDFDDLVRNREQALIDADGDDLAREQIFRDRAHDTLHEAANFVRSAPVSVLKGNLGQTAQVKSGAPTVEVARWQGDDAESMHVACTFSAVPSGFATPNAASDFRPYGVVLWGTRGMLTNAVEVDLVGDGNGATFMVSGSQVLLQVGVDAQFPGLNPTSLIIGGMLSFSGQYRQTPLTRTQYVDVATAAGATTAFLQIKPWARRVWVFRTDAAQSIDIQFQNAGVGAVYTVSVAANTNMTQPVPISGDVTHLKIKNTGAGSISAMRIVYELGL